MRYRPLGLTALALSILAAAACSSGKTGATSTSTSTGGSATGGADGGTGTAGPTEIMTDKGAVQGSVVGTTRAFLGIPYAAAPTGPLRWKPPQPRAAWTGVADATMPAVFCPQLNQLGSGVMAGTSEDCLTVNVWTPQAVEAAGRPVMVWIHGGGFTSGSGADPSFDGQSLSEATGNVIVTLNYRLGPLGFLAMSALDAEDATHPASGNYGFEDQRAALSWVKTNIAAFGGNPASVTLFGESAGGISTCLHLVSPASQGLYHKAIIESGPCAIANNTKAAEEMQGTQFATALGCTDQNPANVLTCLRGKTPDEVLQALPLKAGEIGPTGVSWFPYADGLDLPDQPEALLEAGKGAKVPIIFGTNKNEGTIFFALGVNVASQTDYVNLMANIFGGMTNAMAIVAKYPVTSPNPMASDYTAAAAEAFGDGAFVCSTRRDARALVKGGSSVWTYHFTHAVTTPFFSGLGVFHSSELPFIWQNPYIGITLDAQELTLSSAFRGFWSSLAQTGQPAPQQGVAWPPYGATTDTNMVLDLQLSTQQGLDASLCDFWDSISP